MKSSFQYLKRLFGTRRSVAVLDDFFPNLMTAFRVAEYNWYLERFPRVNIHSTNPDFKRVHAAYAQRYPQFARRVRPYEESSLNDCAFAYMNFLNNAHHFLPALTAHRIPFLLTLYPGGGFGLNEPESDAKLDRVLGSSLLRGIIATQSVTVNYLKDRRCPVPVHDLFGGALHPVYFEDATGNRHTFPHSGATRICFVAERYMPKGANKGYPEFIGAAKQLIRQFPSLKFSVVGSFGPEDIPLDDELSAAMTFLGLLTTIDLKEFFQTQDIIISPNRPYLLHPGNFDGFPTGCCVEASLCGVAVVCSDVLKLNRYYANGEDMMICEPVPEAIVSAVSVLLRDPALLKRIGVSGQRKSQKLYDPEHQLGQRAALLEQYAVALGLDIRAKVVS